ncbi:hypothetical protein ACFQBQ_13775 [Granulicella cerasi]|uniref:Uncharacterized protein n=1 Tax=Granulicella cerasi TaxID=741063 RepID=A0ABW1ZCF2_9BACT
MARVESKMVQLGTLAPAFELVDVISGKALSRDDVFTATWDESKATPGYMPDCW